MLCFVFPVALTTPGLLMVAQVFLGSEAAWSVTIFTLALFTHGAVTPGYLGNGLDIAPNFSGTIFGLANTLSSFGGFLSTWMVGALTYEDVSWKKENNKFHLKIKTSLQSWFVYFNLEILSSMANSFLDFGCYLHIGSFSLYGFGYRRTAALE